MPELSYCADEARRGDPERFACSLFAPADARDAIHAVLAFNLELARVPELVREPLAGRVRIQWWRDALAAIDGGRPPDHPVARALAEAVPRLHPARACFERLLDAREGDLDGVPPPDMEALVGYAEATSSTLAILGLRALGVDAAAATAAARHVGIAWALTGLLRAVPFHGAQRRSYLPEAEVRKAGLERERIFAGARDAALPPVVAEVARRARAHLAAARAERRRIPRQALPALLPATLAGRHLDVLEASGFDPFHPRVQHAGGGRLLRLLVNAMAGRY